MNLCSMIRARFSEYLDGSLTGKERHQTAAHLDSCSDCCAEFASWQQMQSMLSELAPPRPPANLGLRLRIALSKERARTPRNLWEGVLVTWRNSVAPFLWQAAAGLCSAVLLIGTVALLIGTIAAPEPAAARDEPLGMASSPRFLYSTLEEDTGTIGDRDNPVVVEAYVDGHGRVYDYRIVSGPQDQATRGEVENLLLFSVFQPARIFGQPVHGVAVLSFSGVSVRG